MHPSILCGLCPRVVESLFVVVACDHGTCISQDESIGTEFGCTGWLSGKKDRFNVCDDNTIQYNNTVLQEEPRVYVCLRLPGCRIFCIVLLVFAHIYQLVAAHTGISVGIVQFPIRLYEAVSAHRSQGQTLNRVMLDLRRNPLEHGCFCVALSRVRNSTDIIIIMSTPTKTTAQGWARTANVVRQALLPDTCTC